MRKGWEIKSVGECFESIRNGATIKQERGATGIPITRIETLSGGVFNRDRLGYANILSAEKYSSYILDDGDMLLSHINSKTYIGRTVVYNRMDNEEVIHGMNLLRLKTIRTILSPYYAFYCFKSDSFRNQIASYRKDAVNQSSIPVSDLKKIAIPIPPLPEQEKIVSELDCLSGIIEKKRQQLKELDAMAQSIFYEMFGDPVTNEKGWEVKKLGEVAIFKNGLNFKKVETGRKQLFLGVSDFKDKSLISKVDEYSSILIDEEFAEEFLLKDGDIVFVRSNGSKELVGRNVLIYTGNEKIVYSGFCIRCRLMSVDIIPLYANNLLSIPSIKQVIKAFGRGANISNLNQEMLGQIPLPLPPLPLQQTFVSKIESIEKQKGLIKQSIAEVGTLFNARMQEYFE